MSLVDQPGARADSIPDALGGRELPYSGGLASLACPRPDLDDSSPAAQANALDPPRQGAARPDAMLSVAHMAASSSAAPVLPAKSSLRTSRLLASLVQQKPAAEDRPILPHAAPHQVYLSSEEDASSSADDLSDLDELNSDSGQSRQSSSSSRFSHEDTARVVRVVFHGRPSIVDLTRRPPAPGLADGSGRPATGILRTVTEPALMRTRSISSSTSTAGGVTFQLPPRSSSMLPGGFAKKQRPQFLTIDPYAARLPEGDEQDAARAHKTPTAMFKRTLNLVKKRSRPALNPAATPSRECLSPHASAMEQVGEEPEQEVERPPMSRASLSYQNIMRAARRNADNASPTPGADGSSPTGSQHRSRFRAGLSISRPRSIRA